MKVLKNDFRGANASAPSTNKKGMSAARAANVNNANGNNHPLTRIIKAEKKKQQMNASSKASYIKKTTPKKSEK
jgi:hypothetical protein